MRSEGDGPLNYTSALLKFGARVQRCTMRRHHDADLRAWRCADRAIGTWFYADLVWGCLDRLFLTISHGADPQEFGAEKQARDSGARHTSGMSSSEPKLRQTAKLQAVREALIEAGFHTLDAQAAALGLDRGTTWTILTGKHKTSGLRPATINRILASPNLPPNVRAVVLEYAEERRAGRYGHKVSLTLSPDPNAPFEGHYLVYAGERCVGRIHRRRGWRPETWSWEVSSDLVIRNGLPSYGDVTGTRDDAMAAFKQLWEARSRLN
jgi:hypothetical protein